jgi:tetratricopeptide (TPR) repeat protein
MSKADRARKRLQQALALHRAGDLAGAERTYRDVLRLHGEERNALHLLGVVRGQRGDFPDAIALIKRAMHGAPTSAAMVNDLGMALAGAGRTDEAVAAFSHAIATDSGFIPAYNNLGNSQLALGHADAASEAFRQALALRPDYADAPGNLAAALNARGRSQDALEHARAALALDRNFVEARNSAGLALMRLGRAEEAVDEFRAAVAQRSDYVEALSNLGNALRTLLHDEEAIGVYSRSLELRPRHLPALIGRAAALASLHRTGEAIEGFDAALVVDPGSAEAHFERSMLLLRNGQLSAGWSEYEWRWRKADFTSPARAFVQPQWDGKESLTGRTILLHAEQGFGDTIQFCRYAALVQACGARVVLEVQRPLATLLCGLASVDAVVAQGDPLPAFDLHCPLLSLPHALGTTLGTVPAQPSYLDPPADAAAAWARRLSTDRAWRVGLAWAGRRTHAYDRARSVALDQLQDLLDVPGVSFYSLHHELGEQDAQRAAAAPNLVHFGDELAGFDSAAGLAAQLDLVISVDTSLAHLAGALGRPLWLLLAYTPDWRWMLDRDDSPWYPTARLFRQRSPGVWGEVLARVTDELRRKAAARPPQR